MIAQNICHAAVLASHSVLFRSAAALLEVRRGPKNYASYYRDWNHNYQGGFVATFFPFSMPGRLFAATSPSIMFRSPSATRKLSRTFLSRSRAARKPPS
jgi:hypothetical protein